MAIATEAHRTRGKELTTQEAPLISDGFLKFNHEGYKLTVADVKEAATRLSERLSSGGSYALPAPVGTAILLQLLRGEREGFEAIKSVFCVPDSAEDRSTPSIPALNHYLNSCSSITIPSEINLRIFTDNLTTRNSGVISVEKDLYLITLACHLRDVQISARASTLSAEGNNPIFSGYALVTAINSAPIGIPGLRFTQNFGHTIIRDVPMPLNREQVVSTF